jgi:hypothetical protein
LLGFRIAFIRIIFIGMRAPCGLHPAGRLAVRLLKPNLDMIWLVAFGATSKTRIAVPLVTDRSLFDDAISSIDLKLVRQDPHDYRSILESTQS